MTCHRLVVRMPIVITMCVGVYVFIHDGLHYQLRDYISLSHTLSHSYTLTLTLIHSLTYSLAIIRPIM